MYTSSSTCWDIAIRGVSKTFAFGRERGREATRKEEDTFQLCSIEKSYHKHINEDQPQFGPDLLHPAYKLRGVTPFTAFLRECRVPGEWESERRVRGGGEMHSKRKKEKQGFCKAAPSVPALPACFH